MRYRAEIDGLRAVAVIPVILFHAGFIQFSGGFVGVDVFFVISGYLITSIILAELEQDKFSIINFYERRARRILPVLFFVMFCCIPFAWLWLMPLDLKDFFQSIVAVSTFSSNILFWLESDYFDTAAELKPLLHTWSLAVEEQYYIFFPLFLMMLWGKGKRVILGALVLIFLASLSLAQWAAYNAPSANFYLLPTRGWELLIGVFAAFSLQQEKYKLLPEKLNNLLSILGLLLVLFSIFIFDSTTPFPSLYALIPTLGTVLIILFAKNGTLVQQLLSRQFFVGIGLISYSAYLWHQPIFALVKYRSFTEPSHWLMLSLCIAIVALSYLSWRFVEVPLRNKQTYSRRFIFTSGGVLTVAFAMTGLLVDANQLYKSNDADSNLMVKSYQPDNRQLGANSWSQLRTLSGNKDYGVDKNSYDRTQWFDTKDDRKRLLIVGNSHSKDIFNVLTSSVITQRQFQIARFGTQIGNIDETFYRSPNYLLADVVMFASQYKPADLIELETIVTRSIADNKKLILVKNIYEFEEFGQRTYADFLFHLLLKERGGNNVSSLDITKINQKHFEQFSDREFKQFTLQANMTLIRLGDKYPTVRVLDRMDYVCNKRKQLCYAINDDYQKYFYDYGHHTVAGATFFGERVDEVKWLESI
ncbi:acyltransferase family protein [Shewanella sp. GutDb-MelDb]|uniref:acyltransferase family protein n=1 Tax=Shewanella sp. GutDb-MelDb TaxID=2058316 RepID=UPI000C7A1042|nr:acyltransferase family protein [Shewanella sp. GutDb-MelDb]PKG56449.1 acyltransferase [Shewanella sp. GutDb-MelDb]